MPTYSPLGANVRIAAYDLAQSTPSQLVKGRKDAEADTLRAERALVNATPLKETHLPCFGDKTRLHFLDDTPFYLVQAGRSHQDPNPSSVPRALGLVITLPRTTFVELFEKPGSFTKGRRHFQRACVKWDIYFNGEHVLSDFQSSRYSLGSKGVTPTSENGNIRVVSGKRTGYILERPWVLLPPERNADGSERQEIDGISSAEERWQEIGQALLQRASEAGFNKREERSPVGQYLADMAEMKMPEAMARLQQPGGQKFGVIDVILTAGQGAKGMGQGVTSQHYLMEPERLVDPKYKQKPKAQRPSSARRQAAPEQHEQAAGPVVATANDHNLRGLTSTAAFSRQKRNIAVPTSYKDKASYNRTRNDSPACSPEKLTPSVSPQKITPAVSPERNIPPARTPILPAFPVPPVIDFNDAIVVTPTKAEEVRRNRSTRQVSPSEDAVTRSTSAKNMPPPPTIPRSISKRRYSDTISIVSDSGSPSKPATDSARPGRVSGSKSVSGYMGMTRRGIFSKGGKAMPVQNSSPTPARVGSRSLGSSSLPPVSRVVIRLGDKPVLDRQLTLPYELRDVDHVQSPGTMHEPVDEAVLFGSRRVTRSAVSPTRAGNAQAAGSKGNLAPIPSPFANAPVLRPPQFTAKQSVHSTSPVKPMSSSNKATSSPSKATPSPPKATRSPNKATPSSSRTNTSTPKTKPRARLPTPKPSSDVETESPFKAKANVHDKIMAEEREKWHLPELSKDCVITYSEEGEWLNEMGGKGGMMRHVKSGRAGVFHESRVLFGVRYVVGGE